MLLSMSSNLPDTLNMLSGELSFNSCSITFTVPSLQSDVPRAILIHKTRLTVKNMWKKSFVRDEASRRARCRALWPARSRRSCRTARSCQGLGRCVCTLAVGCSYAMRYGIIVLSYHTWYTYVRLFKNLFIYLLNFIHLFISKKNRSKWNHRSSVKRRSWEKELWSLIEQAKQASPPPSYLSVVLLLSQYVLA